MGGQGGEAEADGGEAPPIAWWLLRGGIQAASLLTPSTQSHPPYQSHPPTQLIYALEGRQATRGALAATVRNLGEMLHGGSHPSHLVWHFVVSRGGCRVLRARGAVCQGKGDHPAAPRTLSSPALPPAPAPLQTHERAAVEVEGAYWALLELEARSQGRVMSRPVSACTRVLAPLLLQDWQVGGRAGLALWGMAA